MVHRLPEDVEAEHIVPLNSKQQIFPIYRVNLYVSVSHSFPINTWNVMDGTSMMQALMSHCSNLKEMGFRLPFHPTLFSVMAISTVLHMSLQIRRFVSLSSMQMAMQFQNMNSVFCPFLLI